MSQRTSIEYFEKNPTGVLTSTSNKYFGPNPAPLWLFLHLDIVCVIDLYFASSGVTGQ